MNGKTAASTPSRGRYMDVQHGLTVIDHRQELLNLGYESQILDDNERFTRVMNSRGTQGY